MHRTLRAWRLGNLCTSPSWTSAESKGQSEASPFLPRYQSLTRLTRRGIRAPQGSSAHLCRASLVSCPVNNSLNSPRLFASGGVAAPRNSWLLLVAAPGQSRFSTAELSKLFKLFNGHDTSPAFRASAVSNCVPALSFICPLRGVEQ